MGSESSTLAEIGSNELLQGLTGNLKKEREDTFWNELLGFSFEAPEDKDGSKYLAENVESLCKKIASNNHVTGNFTTLVGVFIFNVQDLITHPQKQESIEECRTAYNALLMIRCICKYFVDCLPEQELIRQFNTLPTCEGTRTIFEEFLLNTTGIICKLPLTNATYYLHLEAANALLTLLSVQMQEMRPTTSSVIHLSIMNSKCSEDAPKVVRRLLHNYIKNNLLPSEDDGSGFLSKTISTVWSIFGVSEDTDPDLLRPLANHSLLLILILSNQLTRDRNPYRGTIFNCKGQKTEDKEQRRKVGGQGSKDKNQNGTVIMTDQLTLNFNRFYRAICRDLQNDQTVLLLYLMLHRNESFMNHILHRDDLGNLVLPLLEILYNAEEHNSHLTYMTLIVLLILSQEEDFNSQMHKTILPDVSWYKDRALHQISLGGLVILVLIRMIQHNIVKMRDKYLHTNCLATLANMSSFFNNLNSYVCDRILSVFATLLKKYSKLAKTATSKDVDASEEFADTTVVEEIIRMFLEILNSCITTRLKENPNLVYTLLHEKEVIQHLQTHHKFQDIMFNINVVLVYFNTRIESQSEQTFSVEDVHRIINFELANLPTERFKKFPELRFKYIEEDQSEDFFVPYVWSLVYKSSYLHWDLEKVALFQLSPPKDS